MSEGPPAISASLLSPYNENLFVENEGWIGLSQILETRGAGSYGLSGPRGSGKSWLMKRAIGLAHEEGGLGVAFPSPSEYEPLAFLAALSDHVAADFEEFYDETTGRSTRASRYRFLVTYSAGGVLAYFALAGIVFNSNSSLPHLFTFGNAVFVLLFLVGFFLVVYAFRTRNREREGLGRIQAKAEELRSKVRFTLTSTDSDELDFGGKHGGLGAILKRTRARQLVERPATLSSLIHDFRAFVEAMAKTVDGPIVIAIDELDKMTDSARVAQLLRDIKGIFEIDGACFLVSISDEAAQALELGAVRTRNEFNSSFYTVITMRAWSPSASCELLQMRNEGFDSDAARALGVLTGGIGRELVRVAERARLATQEAPTIGSAVRLTISDELDAFADSVLRSAVGGPLSGLSDDERLRVFDAIEQAQVLLASDPDVARLVDGSWDLNQSSVAWREKFAEQWRRQLVRVEIAARMLTDSAWVTDDVRAQALQRIVRITSASAAVGRRQLSLDGAPAIGSTAG
jgi:KAP-like P-loop domain-containing protein